MYYENVQMQQMTKYIIGIAMDQKLVKNYNIVGTHNITTDTKFSDTMIICKFFKPLKIILKVK